MFFTPELGKSLLGLRIACFLGRARACVRREERRCEKTEAAIKQGIAAPDWPRYGTRPPFRYLCVLPAVRAAGGGFRRRRGAPCAGRCTLGRDFGLRDAARPRTCRYVIVHGTTDKVHVTNSWQSSRACPMLMLLVLCGGWNFDAVSVREKTQDGRNIPPAQYPGMSHSTVEPYSCTAHGCSVPSCGEKHVLRYAAHTQNAF